MSRDFFNQRISGYKGSYPLYDLQRARDDLVLSLNSGYDRDLEAAMPILGIPNRYNYTIAPSKVLIPELRGHDVDITTLPRSAFTSSFESSYYYNGSGDVNNQWRPYLLSSNGRSQVSSVRTVSQLTNASFPNYSTVRPNLLAPFAHQFARTASVPATMTQQQLMLLRSNIPSATLSAVDSGYISVQSSRPASALSSPGGQQLWTNTMSAVQTPVTMKRKSTDANDMDDVKKSKLSAAVQYSQAKNVSQKFPKYPFFSEEEEKKMKSSDSVKVMIDTSSQPLQLTDPTLKLVYKCDYCPALFGQQNGALKKHLLSHSHPTGSLYLARFSGLTLWLAGVYSMKVESCDGDSSFCVICGTCGYVSSCILMNALHSMYVHHEPNARLKVGNQTDVSTLTTEISTLSVCGCCKATYAKRAGINSHWRSYPTHTPEYLLLRGQNASFSVECPICYEPFQNSIRDLRLHVIQDHMNVVRNNTVSARVTVYANTRQQVFPVLRISNDGVTEKKDELELRGLRQHKQILLSMKGARHPTKYTGVISQALNQLDTCLDS